MSGHRWSVVLLPLPLLLGCEPSKSTTTPSSSPSTPSAATSTTSTVENDALVGKSAPSFSSTAHDGFAVNIDALKGKHVVLYFYPKDETPGCTKEACAFRDAWKDLETKGVVLVGISADSIDSHKQFAEHHKLPFHLVSDPDGSIAQKYGVPNSNGFLGRQSFVIGPDGNVKKVYRKVDVTKHAAEILDDVRS